MSLISIAETSSDDAVGDLGRQRFDGDLAGDVLEHAAVLDAGRVVGALELDRDLGLDRLVEPHLLQVEVLEAAADRVQLLLLDHDRDGFGALDLEVEERARPRCRIDAHLAFGDLEGASPPSRRSRRRRAPGPRRAGGGWCASRTRRGERPSGLSVRWPSDGRE